MVILTKAIRVANIKAVILKGGVMKIEILGPGCPKCQQLAENAEKAIEEIGIEAQVEKVTNINEIANYGIMTTPGLVIDGEVKASGKLLSIEEIKDILKGK